MALLDVNALVALAWDSHVHHATMRAWFRSNDVSLADDDLPAMAGHRQVTDAQLVAVARRNGARLVTFDAGIVSMAQDADVELLRA